MLTFVRPLVLALALGPLSALAAEPLDLNSATATQLEALNGIGPAKAQAIIDYRTKHGPFQKVEDLEKVDGIGPKMLEKLKGTSKNALKCERGIYEDRENPVFRANQA